MNVNEAIQLLKANGYSVTKRKPRAKKADRVGPTFEVGWADGTVTRMSVHTSREKFDFGRAVRVSAAAYDSRHKGRRCLPAISTAAFFEQDGTLLAKCTAEARAVACDSGLALAA